MLGMLMLSPFTQHFNNMILLRLIFGLGTRLKMLMAAT